MPISVSEASQCIRFARETIRSAIEGTRPPDLLQGHEGKQGVFVTLTIDKELRGCIGFPEPVLPLREALAKAAHAAAFEDPRFPRLTKAEFPQVTIEISILTPPEHIRVADPEEYLQRIKVGSDGLIIRSPYGAGLLLPQVFVEYHCSARQALEMTCQKAGIGKDAWRDHRVRVLKFQGQVFKETTPEGKVVEEL